MHLVYWLILIPGTAVSEDSWTPPAGNLSVLSLTPLYLVRYTGSWKVLVSQILSSESKNLPGRPPLEVSVAHTSQLLQLMSHNDLGACAFTNMESLLN